MCSPRALDTQVRDGESQDRTQSIGSEGSTPCPMYERKPCESLSSHGFVCRIFFKPGEKPLLRKYHMQDPPKHRGGKESPGR